MTIRASGTYPSSTQSKHRPSRTGSEPIPPIEWDAIDQFVTNARVLAPGSFVDVPSGNAAVNGIPVEVGPA